VIHDAKE